MNEFKQSLGTSINTNGVCVQYCNKSYINTKHQVQGLTDKIMQHAKVLESLGYDVSDIEDTVRDINISLINDYTRA